MILGVTSDDIKVISVMIQHSRTFVLTPTHNIPRPWVWLLTEHAHAQSIPGCGRGYCASPPTCNLMDKLAVPPAVAISLERAGLESLSEILEYSHGDLVRRTGLKDYQVKGLLETASEAILARFEPLTALDLTHRDNQKLSLGCPLIDECLQGGLLPRSITELAGTSAAGKSQLCLQLSLAVQLQKEDGGYASKVVYISTEGSFPIRRLKELAHFFAHRYSYLNTETLMDNVLIHHTATVQELKVLLNHELPCLLHRNLHNFRLIVIDSLASLFRVEYSFEDSSSRTVDLKSIASSLYLLIRKHNLTIVCTNQMTSDIRSGTTRPALGALWSNMIITRILLLREEGVDNNATFCSGINPVPRLLQIGFAPHLPNNEMHYYIDDEGVHGLDNIDQDMLDTFD